MSKWFALWCVFMVCAVRFDTWEDVTTVMVLTMLMCFAAVLETTVNSR